jgi:DNA-directed RNA polymerase subunit K/omega
MLTMNFKNRQIPPSFGSRFRFINVAAARAWQIHQGSPPKIVSASIKPAHIAMKEAQAGLIEWGCLDVGGEPDCKSYDNQRRGDRTKACA